MAFFFLSYRFHSLTHNHNLLLFLNTLPINLLPTHPGLCYISKEEVKDSGDRQKEEEEDECPE